MNRIKKLEDNLFFKYTIIFIITSAITFSFFLFNGKSLVWQLDGLRQHCLALTYYGQWLREIVSNLLFEHKFSVSLWNFSLGYGADIITTLNYYVIGEPLNLLTIFVPSRYTEYLYDFLVVLRLYLAGLTFMQFCKIMGKKGNGVLAGALVYVFAGFVIFSAVRHPFFMIPMIVLPLLLTGVEKIFRGKRPYQFILSITLAAVSNFYFFYMVAIFTIIYAVVRAFFVYKNNILFIIKILLRMLGYAVIAVFMSAVIFLPILIAFSGGYRSEVNIVVNLFYSIQDYKYIVSNILVTNSDSNWTVLGYSPIIIPALYVMLKKRKRQYILFFAIGIVFLSFPIFGTVLNGFSYVSNRWIWALGFCLGYIVTGFWEEILSMSLKDIKRIAILLGIYLLMMYIIRSGTIESIFAQVILLLFILMMIIAFGQKKISRRKLEYGIILLIIAGIYMNGYYKYSITQGNYVKEFIDSGEIYNMYQESVSHDLKKAVEDETFYRYAYVDDSVYSDFQTGVQEILEQLPNGETALSNNFGTLSQNENASLLFDMNGLSYYWSLTNGNLSRYALSMNVNQKFLSQMENLDDRAALTALASTKYYVSGNKVNQIVPYGFKKTETIKKSVPYNVKNKELPETDRNKTTYYIYENQYALPLGYTYDNYILEKDFEKLDGIEKEEAMLQAVVLEEENSELKKENIDITSENVDYEIDLGENVEQENNRFIVKNKNSSISIRFDSSAQKEVFFSIQGLQFEEINPVEMYADQYELLSQNEMNQLQYSYRNWQKSNAVTINLSLDNVKKNLSYFSPESMYYNGIDDFVINMGYSEHKRGELNITFGKPGVYSFEEISIVEQSMKNYPEQIEQLKENVLYNIDITDNRITGDITVDGNKMLCLTIPYCDGWKVFVDGREEKPEKVNLLYTGVYLEDGSHQIELQYSTPGLKVGGICSIAGLLMFGIMILAKEFRKKSQEEK